MEPWYESSNNSRDLQHISSIKKQKQVVLIDIVIQPKKNDVVNHKIRELKQFAFLQ